MKQFSRTVISSASLAAITSVAATTAPAQVPSYEVRTISTYSTTTTVRGASKTGYVCGDQVVLGLSQPFVASEQDGLLTLPLPAGYLTGFASDVNAGGVIVGAVSQGNFPFDLGEPAIWLPNGQGGWSVVVPQQFATMPGPFGAMPINGGMAVGINDNGTIVGWSRYQGFQGGPSTQFSIAGPPTDLRALGFAATVTDIADHVDVIVGGGLRMDLGTGAVTNLGLPPQQPGYASFTAVLAYSVNDFAQTVATARLATSTPDRYLSYRHDDANGWTPHNPGILPSVFPGFYDNNNLGDVVAPGGVWFEAEGVLSNGFNSLLAPTSSQWTVSSGFLGDDRRVYTTAVDGQTGANAIVVLVPSTCQQSLGLQGPGTAIASFCGSGLASGQSSDYVVAGGPPLTIGVMALSQAGFPNVPIFGGVAASFTGDALVTVLTDASGGLTLTFDGVAGPGFDVVLQTVLIDPALPTLFAFTNAIEAHFGS